MMSNKPTSIATENKRAAADKKDHADMNKQVDKVMHKNEDREMHNIINVFDAMAKVYGVEGKDKGNMRLQNLRRKVAHELIFDELVTKTKSQSHILDVGCGNGLLMLKLLCHPSARVIGLDFSKSMLQEADERLKEQGFKDRYELHEGILQKLPFADHTFDVIVCVDVLHNLPSAHDVKVSIQEMVRVCKPSGAIIVEFKNSMNPVLWYKYHVYDQEAFPHKCYSYSTIQNFFHAHNWKMAKAVPVGFPVKLIAPLLVVKAVAMQK
ncbi:class I SAM-dependent methyltransferase [Candidatus Woesearchaeota archaeon]|nr:class I SAM-dependent methyltransferase [Candidatus Woesearchaeota archaeon]